MEAEHFIRAAEVPTDAHPLPIHVGDPPEPLAARWAAISLCPGVAPTYCLYLLGERGVILEVLQFESMQIALDQARSIVGVDVDGWSRCKLDVPDGDCVDPQLFLGYLGPP